MRRLSALEKQAVISEVLIEKKPLKAVSAKYGCTRQAIFNWIKKYKQAPEQNSKTLENNYRRGNNHHKKLSWKIERLILDLIIKEPDLNVHRIKDEIQKLGKKVSLHGVHNVLVSYNLQTSELRHKFSLEHPVKTVFAHNLVPAYRLKVVEEFITEGKPISQICRIWKISRPTFYKWLKSYQEAIYQEKNTVIALERRYKRGALHHRTANPDIERHVLNLARQKPELSVHGIHGEVLRLAGKPVIGHHGVQNILTRNGLNTYGQRLAWVRGQMGPEQVMVPQEAEVPARGLLIRILSPFATIPKFVISTPVTWPVALPLLLLFAYIFEVDKFFHPTLFFPTIALTFGLVFFIYSLKYYFSLIIVLAYSGQGGQTGQEEQENRGIWNFMRGIFHSKGPKALAIHHDMDKISLEREPFVSIHLPFYNEKRVIDRLLKACTSQKWTNYEVVLADDSTDETTEIVKQLLSTEGRDLKKTFGTDDLEVYVSKKAGGPTVKLIHRSTRSGFKGAALQKALENTDPRAEFVVIFDADYVPYPDTLEQFVKTFSATCGGLEKIADSKIAVVQGYQWHVLNKSENWITRGVRSEYAGSYVVERAGAELYGGLKMIAGSVFAIRTDVLKRFGWGTSITEDLELTLKLYEAGYKVAFTPFIQAPAEAVSTVKRLIRQRMRWAEGHTFNVRKMWGRLFASKNLTSREKFEFLYMGPYYLQAFFFIAGTMAWFLSEAVLKVRLPFWTAAWGWSLVFVNFLSLPMVNLIGLFLEESDERDYLGITSFILLSYVLVPFQAYAAVKALFGKEEGPWFRTPKTGRITDVFGRANLYEWIRGLKIFQKDAVFESSTRAGYAPALNFAKISSFRPLNGYRIAGRRVRWVSRGTIAILLAAVISLNFLAFMVPESRATTTAPKLEQQINIIDSVYSTVGTTTGIVCLTPGSYNGNSATVTYTFEVVEKLSSAGTGGATLTYDAGTCASGAPSGGSTV